MGQCGASKFSSEDEEVDEGVPGDLEGEIYMIVAGIDYSCDRTWAGKNPLDTKIAWQMMQDLGHSCGATVVPVWNEQCTIAGITSVIQQVGEMVGPEDYFIFYYTGHGDRLADDDGDETAADGQDSALCLLGADGNTEPRDQVWMRDDALASLITDNVTSEAKIIVLADCCHSGTIMDVTRSCWQDYVALSIAGCEDKQTSAGTGKGGMFTRALTRAVQECAEEGEEGYSVAEIYNRTKRFYDQYKQGGHTQNITIHGCGVMPGDLAWPLAPDEEYVTTANTTNRGIQITQ